MRHWFPFERRDVELAVAVLAAQLGALSYFSVSVREGAGVVALSLVVLYLAGLLVHSAARARRFHFVPDSAVGGEGHLEQFRAAKRSLLLMHVDDDVPNAELCELYRKLLNRGVEVRRLMLARVAMAPWVEAFGEHPRLVQQLILDEHRAVLRFSFAVVDEQRLVLSLPGFRAVEEHGYTSGLLLRHLMVVDDPELVAVFVRIHQELWRESTPLMGALPGIERGG